MDRLTRIVVEKVRNVSEAIRGRHDAISMIGGEEAEVALLLPIVHKDCRGGDKENDRFLRLGGVVRRMDDSGVAPPPRCLFDS